MPDSAHKSTDSRLDKIERKIKNIYKRASGEITKAWDEYMSQAALRVNELQEEYESAKAAGDNETACKLGRKLASEKRAVTISNKRFKAVSETVAAELSNATDTALAYINGELPPVYALNYNYFANEIGGKTRGAYFNLLNQHTVRNLVENGEIVLPTRALDRAKDKSWNMKKIQSEVAQGILQGESMEKIAGRISVVQEMNAAAAIRTARTAVTGAENQGRLDLLTEAESKGIIVKKKWIATHDERTRDWHSELDGVSVDKDEPFVNSIGAIMFPGDPSAHPANVYNCRCALGYEVVGFKAVKQ